MKDIDAFYYGYGDEDDGVIVPLEMEAEKQGQFPHVVKSLFSFDQIL